jgi:YXWGXW repeat-containing protein
MRRKLIRSLMLALAMMLFVSGASSAQVFLSVSIGPPPLPVYEQPLCPGEDYIWMPGYWAWSPVGFYWVPGTWVLAPESGLLWTPGYWAFEDAVYYWHPGYWGPAVGYYGGIDYGFGYPGTGYYGGYWRDRHFFYNQTVNHVDVNRVHYVYRARVVGAPIFASHVSYNGGPGGTRVRPTAEQLTVARERHVAPTPAQVQHERAARTDRSLLAAENHGRPPIAATEKPGEIGGRGAAAARPARTSREAPENRAAPVPPSTDAPQPENRRGTRGSRRQPEERVTPPPRAEAPRRPQPEERVTPPPRAEAPRHPQPAERVAPPPRAEAPRHPQPAERVAPPPRAEAPPQPRANGRENAPPRPENVPHSERQPRPGNAPNAKPPGKGDDHSDKKAPPHPGEEEHRR